MLSSVIPDVEVVEVLESVEESVEYFSGEVDADVVFMDIHLADGASFRIFDNVEVAPPIIFTTAYDQYLLACEILNHPQLTNICKQYTYTLTLADTRLTYTTGISNWNNRE